MRLPQAVGRTRRQSTIAAAGLLGLLVCAPAAHATFPSSANGRLAFDSDRTGNYEIYTSNPDGSLVTQVTNNPATDRDPAWSPGGAKIAFDSDRTGAREIFVMNRDGSNVVQVTHDGGRDRRPAWSPDGTKIAFVGDKNGSPPDADAEVAVINADGTGRVELTSNTAFDGRPSWRPDGAKIAFTSDRSGDLEIYTMNPDGSNQVDISNDPAQDSDPNYAPDGTKIYWQAVRDANADVWKMNEDGSAKVRLTTQPLEDLKPSPSADGTKVFFVTSRTGVRRVWKMGTDGSNQVVVTTGPGVDDDPDAGQAIGGFSCRASVLRIATLVTVEPVVANAPGTPCASQTSTLANFTVVGVGAKLLSAQTTQTPQPFEGQAANGQGSAATASATKLSVVAAGLAVNALQSNASATCQGGVPVLAGSSSVAGVKIAGITVNVTGSLTLNLLGAVVVRFNEQTVSGGVITQRALHVTAPGLDVVAGEAIADVEGTPCG